MILVGVDIDHQPRRVQNDGRVVGGMIVRLDHHACAPRLILRDANFLHDAVIDIEALAHQVGREPCISEVEIDALGIVEALRLELRVMVQINGNARVIGSLPVLNVFDANGLVAHRSRL